MADNYPQRYFEARARFSNNLLGLFDQQLEEYKHVSLTPTDTIQGKLYFVASVALLGIPQQVLS